MNRHDFPTIFQRRWCATAACMLAALVATLPVDAADWPQWRGPDRNGKSAETDLLQEWPEGGPPLAWKASGREV